MVIERFKNRDPKPIYQRLRESGRQMPADSSTSIAGLSQISIGVFN